MEQTWVEIDGYVYYQYKCVMCGKWIGADDVVWDEHDPYCEECAPERATVK